MLVLEEEAMEFYGVRDWGGKFTEDQRKKVNFGFSSLKKPHKAWVKDPIQDSAGSTD